MNWIKWLQQNLESCIDYIFIVNINHNSYENNKYNTN